MSFQVDEFLEQLRHILDARWVDLEVLDADVELANPLRRFQHPHRVLVVLLAVLPPQRISVQRITDERARRAVGSITVLQNAVATRLTTTTP